MRPMRLVVIVATAFLMSCDAYNWPPYENQLRSMFTESKSVLAEIESEMDADGLSYIGPKPRLRRHGEPELTAAQIDKYDGLFERLRYHWSLSRNDGRTFISVYGPSPRLLGKDFYYSLIHNGDVEGLPSCDAGGRTVSCGMCGSDLGDDWIIQYYWLPKDIGPDWDGSIGEGLPTPEEIQEETQREIDECLEAGLREMGVDLEAKTSNRP